MSDDYKLGEKCYKMIKAFYNQRKSSLLWLRILITKCMKLELKFISEKSCLFINQNDIFMFFYVDDIVFAYRVDREQVVQNYVDQIKRMFEIKDMRSLKFFLEMRVIQNINFINEKISSIYLMQDAYIDK
jgi:hypothetical protein